MQPMQCPMAFYRRNTEIIKIKLCQYTLSDGDTLHFTVKPKPDNDTTDSAAVIDKTWTYGTDCYNDDEGFTILKLTADETNIDFGVYFYDIKIVTVGADAEQTLLTGPLTVMEAATLEV